MCIQAKLSINYFKRTFHFRCTARTVCFNKTYSFGNFLLPKNSKRNVYHAKLQKNWLKIGIGFQNEKKMKLRRLLRPLYV